MSTIGITLVSIAALIAVDIVMYIVLGVIDKHWEERFEKFEKEEEEEC